MPNLAFYKIKFIILNKIHCEKQSSYAVYDYFQLSTLQSVGITHIVCIRHPMEVNRIKPNFPQLFRWEYGTKPALYECGTIILFV